jgi:hypothetical protein
MSEQDDDVVDTVVERFQPTSGRLSGYLGLATAAFVLVLLAFEWSSGTPLGVAIVTLFGAVLVWAAMLRPAVWITRRDLVLRGMFQTDRIPLAAVEKVVVTQVLAVFAGGQRYVSPVVGYTVRQSVKARLQRRDEIEARHGAGDSHQLFVQARIDAFAQDARDRAGVRPGSAEQQALADGVRREWAWLELGAAGVLVLAFVVWLLV